jgi:hypothetical protein
MPCFSMSEAWVCLASWVTGNLWQNCPRFVEKTIKRQRRFLELLKECDLAKEVYAPSLAKSTATSFRLYIFLVPWLAGYDFNIPASAHFCTVILSVPKSQDTLSIFNVVIFRLLSNISHCLHFFFYITMIARFTYNVLTQMYEFEWYKSINQLLIMSETVKTIYLPVTIGLKIGERV